MEVRRKESIAHLAPAVFDGLDRSAGAAACFARVRQRERDGRWRAAYIECRDPADGQVLGVLPYYACRSRAWPDPSYNAATWSSGSPDDMLGTPGSCLVVGSYADRRSGFHVSAQARSPSSLRQLLGALAGIAAGTGRCLIFPFVLPAARMALDAAAGGRIAWHHLGREASFRDISGQDWPSSQRSRVKGVWRRDRQRIEAAGLRSGTRRWHEVEARASKLIADHNIRKGHLDDPAFVRQRCSEWLDCEGVDLVVFEAAGGSAAGVLTALIWQDQLELYEVGLTGSESQDRLAVYLELLFHLPLSYAQSHGLRDIRAGSAAEIPKASRGASFQALCGGVLSLSQARALAHG